MLKNISELFELQGQNVCINAVVLDVGDIQKPTNVDAKPRVYIVLADRTGAISATLYDTTKSTKFVKGSGVMLMNAIVKENFLAITSRSDIGVTKPFTIPESVLESAPKIFNGSVTLCKEMTIAEALASPKKSLASVKGKIVKVSPAETRPYDGKQIPYQEVRVKHHTATSTVAVWQDTVITLMEGQMAKFSKCRVRLFQSQMRLRNVPGGQVEMISHDEVLENVSSSDSDEEPPLVIRGTISAVFEMDPYLSCIKPTCNNKTLNTVEEGDHFVMSCPTCASRFKASHANWYARATVMFEQNNESKKVTLFKPELEKIFRSRTSSDVGLDREQLFAQMVDILPIDVTCRIENNIMKNVVCKRVK